MSSAPTVAPPPAEVAPDLGNALRDRWVHYLKKRRDRDGDVRDDLLYRGSDELRRMAVVTREERPAPAGAPAPTVAGGITWRGIGPQPLRIDREQNFQGAGPASGEVVDVLVDPRGPSDQTLYVAVNNGGVWKSTNGGATWEPRCDGMPSLSMGALAMDPSDPDVIYAGTGNNFDGGAQFNRGRGIYRSVDAGATWTVLADALLANKQVIRIVMPASDVLLVAASDGLYRSIDGGRHFGANAPLFDDGAPLVNGLVSDLRLDTADPATVYAAVRGTSLLRSTDAGVTFTADLFANPGAPAAPFDWISLAQSASPDAQVLYALVTDSTATPNFKGLFRSSDHGATWTAMPGAAGPAGENGGLQNGYDVVVAVDPLDPQRVYIAFQELYLSTDGGLNFGTPAITRNHVHWDHHALVFSPRRPVTAPTRFYAGTDGGLARNDDGNTGWTNLNETIASNLLIGMDIGRGTPANRGFTFAGAQDTGTSQHTPAHAGRDWHLGVDGDGTRVVVDPKNPQRVYARDNRLLIVSSDAGTNWSFPAAAATGLPNDPGGTASVAKPMAVDANASAVVYVASDGGTLFRSSDTGATFTLAHTFPADVSAMATTPLDSKVLVVGCEDGSVHRTADADQGAGATWAALTVTNGPGTVVSGAVIDPTDAKALALTYAGFTGANAADRTRHVFFTADATTTALQDVSGTDGAGPDPNVPDLPVHAVVIDPTTTPHALIIACDVDVLRSTDGGASWHIYGAGLPNTDCTALAIDTSVTPPLLRVGTYGRSAFELARPTGPSVVVEANLAFDVVATGATATRDFDVFNVGSSDLDVTSIAEVGADASFTILSPGLPLTLAPGGHATVTVQFAPTADGKHVSHLSVATTDPSHAAVAVPVSGIAPTSGPRVGGLIPASGPAAGGTTVRVLGSGFSGASAVRFGAVAATGLSIDSDAQVSVLSPPGSGVVDVTVTTPAGTTPAAPGDAFTYLGAGTVVTSLTPAEGPEAGGASVVIAGSGFTGATQVLFAGFAAPGMTVDSDAQVTAVAPPGSGTVDVLVATPTGTSPPGPAARFRYVAPGGGVTTGGDAGGTGATGGGAAGGGAENAVLDALADILRSGTDPEVLEAQRILLRRIALEGNVIDSRVPAPRNITEIGGYINLLTTLAHTDIRTQMLASTLGVAGPATPIGLSGEGPSVAFIRLENDRPDGPAQPSIPTTITVRADFADALAGALARVRGSGAALPLLTGSRTLPAPSPGRPLALGALDVLELLGRALRVVPAALLRDPATDPVAIARLDAGPVDAWTLAARELDDAGAIGAAAWVTFRATPGEAAVMPPALLRLLPLGPILAAAGWYAATPVALPTSSVDQGSLPRLVNTTGLVAGETRLGDELGLLYPQAAIAASALAGMATWVWNGTAFVPPAT